MSEAIGPDSIYNMCQLAEWHMLHFKISFSQETVPTIVPVPKKVFSFWFPGTPNKHTGQPGLDAFGANRSTDDAK